MADERLQFVLTRLWLAALEAASGLERRASAGTESAAAVLATIHGGQLLDWRPPPPPSAHDAPQDDAKR
jgi:hypothetical protein